MNIHLLNRYMNKTWHNNRSVENLWNTSWFRIDICIVFVMHCSNAAFERKPISDIHLKFNIHELDFI